MQSVSREGIKKLFPKSVVTWTENNRTEFDILLETQLLTSAPLEEIDWPYPIFFHYMQTFQQAKESLNWTNDKQSDGNH